MRFDEARMVHALFKLPHHRIEALDVPHLQNESGFVRFVHQPLRLVERVGGLEAGLGQEGGAVDHVGPRAAARLAAAGESPQALQRVVAGAVPL